MSIVLIHALYTVIMITYLHHTDPTLPHYRGREWNFQRGAAATIDRNFLGWQGRFFLHDVAHYHVIHHVGIFFFRRSLKDPSPHFHFSFESSSPRCLSVRSLSFMLVLMLSFRADPDDCACVRYPQITALKPPNI